MKGHPLWRVFPWDPNAPPGARFSAAFVPGGQGGSRFDLAGHSRGVIYLAGSEEHAVAEAIQAFRNTPTPLADDDLSAWGHRLALVRATLSASVWEHVADLCEPRVLDALGIRADDPAARDRARTQCIAAAAYDRGDAGLHWWSAFWGEWHSAVLFRDRLVPGALVYDTPVALEVDAPAVREAARLLDIG